MHAKLSGQSVEMSGARSAEGSDLRPAACPTGPRQDWAIGIYTGDSTLHLSPPAEVQNPVLSAKDVCDAPAVFLADPFIVIEAGTWHMFFEVMNGESDKGEIGHAISPDGRRWQYGQLVLIEPFHLSYPYVFRWGGRYYMIPETLAANAVCLYQADPFPTRWSCVRRLVPLRCADPSVFRHNGMWWM